MPWRRRRTHGASHAFVGLLFLLLFVAITIGGITIANTFTADFTAD